MTTQVDPSYGSAAAGYFEAARNEFVGDAASEVAVMMLEHAKNARQETRTRAMLEDRRCTEMEGRQVDAMRREAEFVRRAGTARGIGQMVAGGMGIASGSLQLSSNDEAVATGTAKLLEGSGKAAAGGGELVAAEYEGRAALARAHATEYENRAAASSRRRQQMDANIDEANQLARAATQHLESVAQSRAAANQAAIFVRG